MENFLTFKSTSAVDDDDKMRFWQMFDQQKAFNFISAGNIVRDLHHPHQSAQNLSPRFFE